MAEAGRSADFANTAEFATIVRAQIIENGEALAVLVQERDGTISAVRISVEQLAD